MKRNVLEIPDEYTTALSEQLEFDLSPESLVTQAGRAFIAQKAEIISRISKGLTTNRTEFLASKYLQGKEIRKAYAFYYMTTNVLKILPPLLELSRADFFENISSIRILDLGTGTGAAIWGVLNYLYQQNKCPEPHIVLSDSLQENLLEAQNFSRHFLHRLLGVAPKLSFEKFDLRHPSEIPEEIKRQPAFDLLTMMNVLNELDEVNDELLYDSLMSLLQKNGSLIIIEPATRNESRRLLRFRDMAVRKGATVYSPCTRQAECPALGDEDNWCHSDAAWKRPAYIKAVDDIIGTLRLSLKYSYLILRKDGVTLSQSLSQNNLYRIVSERFNEKGRIRAILCGERGRYEHIMNKRDLSDKNSDFSEILRYDIAKLKGEEVREHDRRLLKETEFSIVLPILGAR